MKKVKPNRKRRYLRREGLHAEVRLGLTGIWYAGPLGPFVYTSYAFERGIFEDAKKRGAGCRLVKTRRGQEVIVDEFTPTEETE